MSEVELSKLLWCATPSYPPDNSVSTEAWNIAGVITFFAGMTDWSFVIMNEHRPASNSVFLSDCTRIHQQWHDRAKSLDTEGLLALYAKEAVLETPLVQAIFDDRESGIVRGHREIRPFFEEGARRRPNALVRWHRTGRWLTDGERLLVWEYPRQAPDGDQVDLVEVMEIADGLIQYHRIYWGWFGTALLTRGAVDKVRKMAGEPDTCSRGASEPRNRPSF